MQQSCKILSLTRAVDDMAFRADLLALNAAIELAGGADSGAECQLTSEEIRCLAERGALAANDIPQGETQIFEEGSSGPFDRVTPTD